MRLTSKIKISVSLQRLPKLLLECQPRSQPVFDREMNVSWTSPFFAWRFGYWSSSACLSWSVLSQLLPARSMHTFLFLCSLLLCNSLTLAAQRKIQQLPDEEEESLAQVQTPQTLSRGEWLGGLRQSWSVPISLCHGGCCAPQPIYSGRQMPESSSW